MSSTVKASLKASLMKEGQALAAAWMKHKRAESQAAKRSKVATEARRVLATRPTSSTQSASRFLSHVDLTASSPTSRHDPALVGALGDIALTIRENTREVKRVSAS